MVSFNDDLSEFYDPHLYLKVHGKTYRIPAESADDGLRIRQIIARGGFSEVQENTEALKRLGAEWVEEVAEVPITLDGVPQIDTATGKPLMREGTLNMWRGGVYDEMAADGLTIDEIIHVGTTALMKTAFGIERAEEFWTQALNTRAVDAPGKEEPPQSGAPSSAPSTPAKKTTPRKPTKKAPSRAARKTAAKKASSKAATGSTTRARARTAPKTPAAPTTTQ